MRYAAAIFLSAFLLFLVQSVAGKQLLPWFGGTPATWAACMLFFQLLLLAGYLYAWLLDRWCAPRGQRVVHLFVTLAALGVLAFWAKRWGAPLLAPETWKPRGSEAPVAMILRTLALSVGLPFFALAANSPLLQRWASESLTESRVYRLYAVSNAGSLLGLLSFPLLFEPRLSLPALASVWSWLFALLVVLLLGASLWPRSTKVETVEATDAAGTASPPGWLDWLLWTLLAATASAMFLATTNQLCQEIALVPLLWVLPLAIYLGAFMITFHDARWYGRAWLVPTTAVATVVVLVFAYLGMRLPIPHQIAAHAIFLFLFCLVCLGELYRMRPAASRLTGFYLAVAVGGALGGALISVAVPALFKTTSEFYVMLLAGWIVIAVVFARAKSSFFFTGGRWFFYAVVFLVTAALLRIVSLSLPQTSPGWMRGVVLLLGGGLVMTAGIAWLLRRRPGVVLRPIWPRLLIGATALLAELFMLDHIRSSKAGLVAHDRNFFGAVQVQKLQKRGIVFTQMIHGQINHGFQYDDPVLRRQPAGYCNPDSGVGLALTQHARRDLAHDGKGAQPLRIGVAGLGVGAMASYLRAGDYLRFYEINPLVIDYAAGSAPHFTYCRESVGQVETVLGDARLSLEREWLEGGSQQYDILILDAFSSDSVPVHLLTVEAFDLYLRHLRDENSLLAVNISNRFLDFRPLLRTVATHFRLEAGVFMNIGNPPIPTANLWVILARRPHIPEFFATAKDWPTPTKEVSVLWTDNHSDIFSLLRWERRVPRVVIIEPPNANARPAVSGASEPAKDVQNEK